MLRFILVVCLCVFLTAFAVSALHAESTSGAEIGTLFGLSRFSADGGGTTVIGVPSAFVSSAGNPSIYVSWFPDERFSFGPVFSLGRFSGEGTAFTALYLAGRGALQSGGGAASGAYVYGRGAIQVIIDGESGVSESETDFGLGAGLGYRWRVGSGSVVRAEGGYRRWFGDLGTNEIALLIGLGGRAGRVAADRDIRSSQAEIGTHFGFSRFSTDGEGVTLIGVPSPPVWNVAGNPWIYVSWFPDDRISFGPEFSLGRTSGDGTAFTTLYLAGRGALHSGGGAASGAYVYGLSGLRVISTEIFGDSESETDFGLGAGLGYRWRVGTGFIVRAEGGYRRWFDNAGTNEFVILLGLGASVGGG